MENNTILLENTSLKNNIVFLLVGLIIGLLIGLFMNKDQITNNWGTINNTNNTDTNNEYSNIAKMK